MNSFLKKIPLAMAGEIVTIPQFSSPFSAVYSHDGKFHRIISSVGIY
jgi:hypothetical protein